MAVNTKEVQPNSGVHTSDVTRYRLHERMGQLGNSAYEAHDAAILHPPKVARIVLEEHAKGLRSLADELATNKETYQAHCEIVEQNRRARELMEYM